MDKQLHCRRQVQGDDLVLGIGAVALRLHDDLGGELSQAHGGLAKSEG